MRVCVCFVSYLSLTLRERGKVKFKVTTPHRFPFGVHLVQKKVLTKKEGKKGALHHMKF